MTLTSGQAYKRLHLKPLYMVIGFSLMFIAVMMIFSSSASAHGYIESPGSRAYLCKTGQNANCGNVQYEPQSLEAKGNFPEAGPADGQIAGAGVFPELNEQTPTRWAKVNLNGGQNTFTWRLTAAHATKEWKYYITKKGWDSSKPLTRADLELFCSFNDGGKRPESVVTHTCNVPTDRTGYNLILGVWEIADTGNAFYNVIDVNLNNGGGNGGSEDTQAPSAPTGLRSTDVTSTSVSLAWNASNDNAGVTGYDIYRGSQLAGTAAGTALNYTVAGLAANTEYTFTVKARDAAGNVSAASNPLSVTTSGSSTPEITAWELNKTYAVGDLVTYGSRTYECLQPHTSSNGWEPPNVPALWLMK
ncbi:lytic polysaccharide monooxygenase [Paenibacillus sp. DMB20]|uniref:lytic polysaccharide monooxygenase n=1 Tax=Paenibacillus sp. DMB20 TaxID=1642570 RepID=UPI000627D2D7|nr:lytic polysaccharide monooxygenase [Paenibacillus sp. DMB20]KKO53872.1 chitin-binding protein [Paenibacillus sp. DMB20]